VSGLTRDPGGRVNGAHVRDEEGGREFHAPARVVVNATGVYCDAVRRMVEPAAAGMVAPSRGAHVVLARSFLPGDTAFVVPKTPDGRVMFAIPWHDHTVVGTTDTPIAEATLEPLPFETEVEFILTTAARYLEKAPTRSDVLSVFVGIRPLVRAGEAKNTAALSRDHTIHIDDSALLTVAGGKWTTYRHMAEDCVDQAATLGRLPERSCITKQLNIHGFHDNAEKFGDLSVYGSDAVKIMELARAEALPAKLHPDLPYTEAEVVWAVREEMARTVEDVLARRTRALFLNTRAAISSAPRVSELLAHELHLDEKWRLRQIANFRELAAGYLIDGGPGEARTV
jgi:glycerol-3-phosphate dehydrogenase